MVDNLFLVLVCPDPREQERAMRMHRRDSDSNLYCKARDGEQPKESRSKAEKPVMYHDQGPEEESRSRYLDQERLAIVQSYLKKAVDARSMTTETSDSGIPRTHGAPSEFGLEEISGN